MPSPHSQTTRGSGAHKDSDHIAPGDSYQLGEYTFTIQNVVSEGERVIQAHCSGPGGNAAHGISVNASYQLSSWYVVANETTADVYAVLDKYSLLPDIAYAGGGSCTDTYTHVNGQQITDTFSSDAEACCYITNAANNSWLAVFASHSPFTVNRSSTDRTSGNYTASQSVYQGEIYYYTSHGISMKPGSLSASAPINSNSNGLSTSIIAAAMLFTSSNSSITKLVGRFEINLEDAGGVGPDSDWEDPGDYEEGREPEEPTHTLHVNVNGALSGRHNDPLNDTSYSYVPADKATKKPYGCGGDGGHGGGGGAGASSVVIYKFATNRADSKELLATAKRHGYGSGGGKGGKGGDGIVLIYY